MVSVIALRNYKRRSLSKCLRCGMMSRVGRFGKASAASRSQEISAPHRQEWRSRLCVLDRRILTSSDPRLPFQCGERGPCRNGMAFAWSKAKKSPSIQRKTAGRAKPPSLISRQHSAEEDKSKPLPRRLRCSSQCGPTRVPRYTTNLPVRSDNVPVMIDRLSVVVRNSHPFQEKAGFDRKAEPRGSTSLWGLGEFSGL